MDFPLISVVMPVYNAELYISESIESILNQTYKNFEFIIINDGSFDNTEEIINSYKDPRISYFKTVANNGLVATLNFGLSQCKGEFIARMDADDWAYPERLRVQLNFLLNNPQIGVCGTNVDLWNGKKIIGKWIYPITDSEIKTSLFFKCSLAHPTIIFRKSLVNNIEKPYEQGYFPAEDYRLWVNLTLKTSFHNLDKSLLKYRKNPKQISSINSNQQSQKAFEISWSQVIDLNVDEDSLAIYHITHRSFIVGPWPKDRTDLSKLIRWAEILINANEREKKYDYLGFNSLLAHKIWKICYFLSSKKINSANLFYQSVLSSYYSPSHFRRMISFIKNLQYR